MKVYLDSFGKFLCCIIYYGAVATQRAKDRSNRLSVDKFSYQPSAWSKYRHISILPSHTAQVQEAPAKRRVRTAHVWGCAVLMTRGCYSKLLNRKLQTGLIQIAEFKAMTEKTFWVELSCHRSPKAQQSNKQSTLSGHTKQYALITLDVDTSVIAIPTKHSTSGDNKPSH